jgi:hypothetical protein
VDVSVDPTPAAVAARKATGQKVRDHTKELTAKQEKDARSGNVAAPSDVARIVGQ